jgi:hypothetical protein
VGSHCHAPAALLPVPIVQETGWAQGRSGQVRKISPVTGIRSSDRSARSELLYRLSYPVLKKIITCALKLCAVGRADVASIAFCFCVGFIDACNTRGLYIYSTA